VPRLTAGMELRRVTGEGGMPESFIQQTKESFFRYGVYGISLSSQIPLSLPADLRAGFTEIELRIGSPSLFSAATQDAHLQESPWGSYRYAHLKNGSSYARWEGVGEFLVSRDGRCVTCARFTDALESFQVYLLGHALSFALVKNGFEPLHATCVVVDGQALAFVGDSGFGKSSLAASFLEVGHLLLTDDLLMLRKSGEGFAAYPGPPRIKLFPEMATRFLGEPVNNIPMNSGTRKLIIPLDGGRACASPVPLRIVYALGPPSDRAGESSVRIEPLSPRKSFLAILSNTFNYVILDPSRLQRQFAETARLATVIPVKQLSYPRRVSSLSAVRDAILSDLDGQQTACRA
jgi:hypothetical protein